LIGEGKFRRPVRDGTAGELAPALIDMPFDRIAITYHQQLAGDIDEMLLVVGPAQAARQLQVWRDVVINLAEQRVGIQIVGVLAEEVVMALIVERGYG